MVAVREEVSNGADSIGVLVGLPAQNENRPQPPNAHTKESSLESVITCAIQLLGPTPADVSTTAILDSLSKSDVHHAWQLRFLTEQHWAELGVSIGLQCSIARVLSTGVMELESRCAREECETEAASRQKGWSVAALQQQVPWAVRYLRISGLIPDDETARWYRCYWRVVTVFTLILSPLYFTSALVNKALPEEDRWMVGDWTDWTYPNLCLALLNMLTNFAWRRYCVRVSSP